MNEKQPERAGYLKLIQLALPRAARTRILFQPRRSSVSSHVQLLV